MLTLALLLACGSKDDPDPSEVCRDEGTWGCCSDDECDDDSLCHFQYTCATRGDAWTCTEPVGDRQCHQLCAEDTGGASQCEVLSQECQAIQHAQGTDYYEDVTACF